MTFRRVYQLIDVAREERAQDLYETGMAVALAFNEPKRLKELIAPKPAEIDMSKLPAMLRPKKRSDA